MLALAHNDSPFGYTAGKLYCVRCPQDVYEGNLRMQVWNDHGVLVYVHKEDVDFTFHEPSSFTLEEKEMYAMLQPEFAHLWEKEI